MTGTTNLGLKKIDGTENWRNIFDYHNDSMDTLDQAVSSVENVEANFAVTIPVSGWTLSNGEYSYTWGNATITSKTSVVVEFVENADEIDVDYIEAEKVTQGVKFTAPWIPNYAISVNIKITYAAETDIAEITGDMVATDAITGAANVDEAFTELDTNLSSLNDSIASQNIIQLISESAKYTFPQGQFSKSHYVVRGNVCYISTVFNCVTASATAERICGSLPNPALDDHTCCPGRAISWTVTTDIGVQVLVQNGVMYFCGGTAGRMYSLAFSYPVDVTV